MADTIEPVETTDSSADRLLNTESMIKRLLGDIEKFRSDIKEQKDMFDSTFENDAVYAEKLKKEDEVKKEKEAVRQTLLKTSSALAAGSKLKELKEELKDTQKSLEGLLKEYQILSGSNQITRDDGEIYEIVTSYKIKKMTV